MKDFDVNKLWVSMGDHDTRVLDTNEKFIQAEKIIIHHNYEPRNFQHNDIGNLFPIKPTYPCHLYSSTQH